MDEMGAISRLSAAALCLALVFGLAGVLAPAAAQQGEKRIALVVGNGAYTKSPLATAANDAGLIAQTLQAAGFDVIGARDLDGDTLRRSLRDFTQKAETSGPDTVAMIYLAGYGVQLAGENYFVPVDSAIGRETDIPTEGLRIADYVRRIGSLPLKASVVVLDAARQQPFVEGGQPIASGLALVEPEPRMLIAFNAAPGTVAPVEQGSYGAYAQSLAEMIRTGGLTLPELFDRVRLRVNENTKGTQVPWHAQKLDTNFLFFDRAPDAPAPASPDQAAAMRSRPIRDLGVRDAYAAALERDTLQGYDEFVAAYPGDPLARRVRALAAARREAITWMRTYRADTPQAYWSYLRRYPNGPHAADARRRLAILTAPLEPPPAFAVIDYDVPPPPPEEIVYIDRRVVVFSDPYYDFAPPPPPPVYFLPPPPPDFVILAPPPPPIGLFILPQPVFVPIPVYVRAPAYVAPPPNNIIFANIHNTTVINTVINRPPAPQPGAVPAPGQGVPGAAGPLGAKGGIQIAAPGAASPALPPSVAQKATLIQQGKAPLPPSASINPAVVKPGAPGSPGAAAGGQGGVAPNALPANAPPLTPQGQPLPKANALPVPGARGAPTVPQAGTPGAPSANPNAKTVAPSAPLQATAPAAAAPAAPAGTGLPKGQSINAPAPGGGAPKPGGPPAGSAGSPPKPGSAALAPPSPPTAPPPPTGAAGAPPKPGITSAPKPPPGVPPTVRAPPPAPSQASRPIAPPPPPRASAPPPPPARVAVPSPPPRMSAPPPPPPRVSAPPPPPPRISAPPPAPARMAAPPPPPPPRMAAPPPPPRPAPPPPAAVKRCPPNVPNC